MGETSKEKSSPNNTIGGTAPGAGGALVADFKFSGCGDAQAHLIMRETPAPRRFIHYNLPVYCVAQGSGRCDLSIEGGRK